ncbi:MAG: hypothetical protein IPP47_00395 [Bryobacterales bacterium]|nr:hypothetical protein [Bryobacterales bacterium]
MPAQYTMPAGPEPAAASLPDARLILSMADADIDAHIVADVMHAETGEPARWTNARPAFRMVVDDVEDLDFYIHLFLPESTFASPAPSSWPSPSTAPSSPRPSSAARATMSSGPRCPPGSSRKGAPVALSFEVRPPYQSPQDGTKLGVLLFSIGFRKQGA